MKTVACRSQSERPKGRLRGAMALACAALLAWASCEKPEPPRVGAPASVQIDPAPAPDATPWFEEVAAQAGIDFQHHSGHQSEFYMPEMVTGGVGLLDYDNDGLLDIFLVNGGSLHPAATNSPGSKLYRNLGAWRFEDVTARAGLGGSSSVYGMGCACADFDRDGDVDLFVTHLRGGLLFRNEGTGTFANVTRDAGIDTTSWGTSAAFLDYDGDGQLDLFIANYIRWSRESELSCYSRGGVRDYCSPVNYKAPAVDTLYRNLGGGRFKNVTSEAGLDQAYGNGLGVGCADFDQDGRIDVFVANDGVPNQFWRNQGNGQFKDEAWVRGCAVSSTGMPRAGMGVAVVDSRQTGWLDLFVTHLVGEGNGWFVNTNGYFVDTVAAKGPTLPSLPMTGFGVGFADFNLDGRLDVYVANGRVKLGVRDLDPRFPYAEPNTLLKGLGDGQFTEIKPEGGTASRLLATGRGAAFGDLDNDGDIDAVVNNKDGPPSLLRNIAPRQGSWILFRVLDEKGTDALNAVVKLETPDGWQRRDVIPNQGYCSSNDPRVHFGLPKPGSIQRVLVRWPNGQEENFGPFEPDRFYVLRQRAGRTQ